MKRLYSLMIVGLLFHLGAGAAAATGTLSWLDESNGFRDIRFGTPFDSFTLLDQVETLGSDKLCYVRTDEDLNLGNARLVSIQYCFYHKRLWAVVLNAAGPYNVEALYRYLQQSYGSGIVDRSTPGDVRRVSWKGEIVRAEFHDAAGGVSAQARLWSTALESAPPASGGAPADGRAHTPIGHADHDPRPLAARGYTELHLEVPLHARPGLTVQISLRYRNLVGPGRVRVKLPDALLPEQAIPDAFVGVDNVLVWGDLRSKNGSLKLKARIDPDAAVGRALLIKAELDDSDGNHRETRETIVLH